MAPRDDRALTASGTSASEHDDISRVYLIRHGDRFDYADDHWAESAKQHGALLTDPPLSALGHRQARETADYLLEATKRDVEDGGGGGQEDSSNDDDDDERRSHRRHGGVSKILVSPYLRVIQTAAPTSDVLGLPLSVEYGLSEAHATPGVLPSARDRFAYFPHLDPSYESLLHVEATPGHKCRKTGHPCEAFAGRYVERMGQFARRVENAYRGKTVVCFSHAASVALVAAFLRCSMKELKFAPCGVYELQRRGDGPWELLSNGEANAHVSENSPTTYPWGFAEKHFVEGEGGHYFGSSEGIGLDYFVP